MKKSKLLSCCICLMCTATMLIGCGARSASSGEENAPRQVEATVQAEGQEQAQEQDNNSADIENGSAEAQGMDSEEENPLVSILDGTGTFMYAGSALTLDNYLAATGLPAKFDSVAAVDFDGDGVKEALLNIMTDSGDSYGVLVLHQEDGGVWGYTFSLREMSSPKNDGTFTWSAGAANNGVATISLSAGSFEYNNLFWSEMGEDGAQHCFNGEQEISADDYYAALDEWDTRESAAWYAYPMDTYSNLF